MGIKTIQFDPTFPRRLIKPTLRDGVFRMLFYWVGRLDSWFVDIRDSQDVPLVTGKRIAVSSNFLYAHRSNPEVPQGALLPVDLRQGDIEASRNSLGRETILLYLEPSV